MKQVDKLIKLIKAYGKKKRIYFFFDYDGVLTPIQSNPATSYLETNIKRGLVSLSTNPLYKVAIVSGRNLDLLKRLTGVNSKKITLVGSHGLEILHHGKNRFLSKKNLGLLNKIKPKVINLIKSTSKGFIENKPYTITYHVRDSKSSVKLLSRRLNQLLKQLAVLKQIQVLEGKNIIEVMPKEITKGNAVERIIKPHQKHLPIFLGDDVTDISAFKAIKKYKGITVSLNPNLKYKADFIVNQKDINKILDLR